MVRIKKIIGLLSLLVGAISLAACGTPGSDVTGTAIGWHFQGIDCLSCHNVDLAPERQHTVAGTVFLSPNIIDSYDLSSACGGVLRIQLLDAGFNLAYDSKNYEDPGSRGYKGKGNVFILKRRLASLNGDYFIRIVSEDGTLLAQSGTLHSFTSSFNRLSPADLLNRYSCNACHSKNPSGGAAGGIYVQTNANKCQ